MSTSNHEYKDERIGIERNEQKLAKRLARSHKILPASSKILSRSNKNLPWFQTRSCQDLTNWQARILPRLFKITMNFTGVLVVQWLAHMPFTSVTRVRFLLSAVIRLKFHLGLMWEECFQFDSTKHRGFSPGTPVCSCTNTGPMRDGPYWTSRFRIIIIYG